MLGCADFFTLKAKKIRLAAKLSQNLLGELTAVQKPFRWIIKKPFHGNEGK